MRTIGQNGYHIYYCMVVLVNHAELEDGASRIPDDPQNITLGGCDFTNGYPRS